MSGDKLSRTERVLQLVVLLSGHEMTGRRVATLAEKLKTSSANVSRDLAIMKSTGFVETLPEDDEAYRLGPTLIQVAMRHAEHIDDSAKKVESTRRRYQG